MDLPKTTASAQCSQSRLQHKLQIRTSDTPQYRSSHSQVTARLQMTPGSECGKPRGVLRTNRLTCK